MNERPISELFAGFVNTQTVNTANEWKPPCKWVTADGHCNLKDIKADEEYCLFKCDYLQSIIPATRDVGECGYKALAADIIIKSILEYSQCQIKRELAENKREKIADNINVYLKMLIRFFQSDWCEDLLQFVGINIPAAEILRYITKTPLKELESKSREYFFAKRSNAATSHTN